MLFIEKRRKCMSESIAGMTPPDELLDLLSDISLDFNFMFSCVMAIHTKEETGLIEFLKTHKNLTPDDVTEYVLLNIMAKRANSN